MEDAEQLPVARIGSRAGPDDIWQLARHDFLAGDSAAVVCERYDLGKSTFWARASAEGWRRADQLAPVAVAFEELEDMESTDLMTLARLRLCQALAGGRATEAAGWLKIYEQLRDRASDDLF